MRWHADNIFIFILNLLRKCVGTVGHRHGNYMDSFFSLLQICSPPLSEQFISYNLAKLCNFKLM
jgi:hypothetical protein